MPHLILNEEVHIPAVECFCHICGDFKGVAKIYVSPCGTFCYTMVCGHVRMIGNNDDYTVEDVEM